MKQLTGCDVSIILPLKNMSGYISSALKKLSEINKDISIEFIIVDIGSCDNTVLESLDAIKEYNLNGCVIQSGKSPLSAVLNAGIKRSTGDYITFEFLGDFCIEYIEDFYNFAKKNEVQVLINNTSDKDFSLEDNYELFTKLFNDSSNGRLNNIFISNSFIEKNDILFNEACIKYYTYDFLSKLFMLGKKIYNCGKVYEKEDLQIENDALSKLPKTVFFEFVDTNIKLYEFAQRKCKNDKTHINDIKYNIIPAVILEAINKLLQEGYKPSSIKTSLKSRGYDIYLKTNKISSIKLKRDIILWNRASYIYSKLHR